VNDIDPYGKNLQEFISSLTPANLSSYNTYMEKTLGIRARTETKTGHQSIMVKNDRGEFNITDVGFGYSQILPIVTKLWYTVNKRSVRVRRYFYFDEKVNSVILMEQPELHLHPAYQAKIADAFVNAVTEQMKEEDTLRLIIETHSDTILNRIGRRVREGKIRPEDVNIILFEKKPGEPTTQLRQTTYNQKGQIKEWPYGFFDPLED
jgi:predicted ATPase